MTISERCRLACGAEAIARDFPEQAGYDLYEGCITADIAQWSDERFINWLIGLEMLYGRSRDIIKLCQRCCEIIKIYGALEARERSY